MKKFNIRNIKIPTLYLKSSALAPDKKMLPLFVWYFADNRKLHFEFAELEFLILYLKWRFTSLNISWRLRTLFYCLIFRVFWDLGVPVVTQYTACSLFQWWVCASRAGPGGHVQDAHHEHHEHLHWPEVISARPPQDIFLLSTWCYR